MDKNTYKLLTPGPLTTTASVKEAMEIDRCTWDEDYKNLTQKIRAELLHLAHADSSKYTAVLMQGSGTFGVESVISSVIGAEGKLLVLQNGAYSKRIAKMAQCHNLEYTVYEESYDKIPDSVIVEEILKSDPAITHIAMVHSETTSGILNDIQSIGRLAKAYNKRFIVDAMSSFGGVDISVPDLGITYLVSSANKCIQGVPGFSFIIAEVNDLVKCRGIADSVSLDLFAQWETMENDGGKWRFTSPTHVVAAFAQALKELEEEGGIQARAERYNKVNRALRSGLEKLGFKAYVEEDLQGPIITTFIYPEERLFSFNSMYTYLKNNGYVIYPGKLTDIDTFRLGNIGEIYMEDVDRILAIFRAFIEENR